MKVTLVNCTPEPEKTIYAAWMIMHKYPVKPFEVFVAQKGEYDPCLTSRKIVISIEDFKEALRTITKQAHQGALEMVHFNFLIEGVSRAFQQQLTRTRQASFCIQSLRVIRCDNFSDEGNFLPFGDARTKGDYYYGKAMEDIQSAYRNMIAAGASTAQARGVLPLAIFSPIWMSINLRYLIHLVDKTVCTDVQGEFKAVAQSMIEAIQAAHPLLAECFLREFGCNRTKVCNGENPCGQHPSETD